MPDLPGDEVEAIVPAAAAITRLKMLRIEPAIIMRQNKVSTRCCHLALLSLFFWLWVLLFWPLLSD